MAQAPVKVRISGFKLATFLGVLGFAALYVWAAPQYGLPAARDVGGYGKSVGLGLLAGGASFAALALLLFFKPGSTLTYDPASRTMTYTAIWRTLSAKTLEGDQPPQVYATRNKKSYQTSQVKGEMWYHTLRVSGVESSIYESSSPEATIALGKKIAAAFGTTFKAHWLAG